MHVDIIQRFLNDAQKVMLLFVRKSVLIAAIVETIQSAGFLYSVHVPTSCVTLYVECVSIQFFIPFRKSAWSSHRMIFLIISVFYRKNPTIYRDFTPENVVKVRRAEKPYRKTAKADKLATV